MIEELLGVSLYNQRAEIVNMEHYAKSTNLFIFVYPNNRNPEFLSMLEVLNRYAGDKIAINTDSVDENLNVAAQLKIEFDILSDPSRIIIRRLGAIAITRVGGEDREVFIPTAYVFIDGRLERKASVYKQDEFTEFLNSIRDPPK
ncbi:MAG: hypothetical protein QW785_01825 [Candidatus Anstonellales archaeon]